MRSVHRFTLARLALCGAALSLSACGSAREAEFPRETGPVSAPTELVLERALPIEAEGNFQPSGLTASGGQLFTVSDKHDGTVFELELTESTAHARPVLRFRPPGDLHLDLEAVERAPDGAFWLASETQGRLLRVTLQGDVSWLTPALRECGQKSGLFAKPNAGLEGLALLGEVLVLAAEREPRGLLELERPFTSEPRAYRVPNGPWPAPLGRPHDFSDLAVFDGELYALERNTHLVVHLAREHGRFREVSAWSYARAENDAALAFVDRRFGLGEGLALDARYIYVVLDNNGQPRAKDPADHRPLLLVFRRPGARV